MDGFEIFMGGNISFQIEIFYWEQEEFKTFLNWKFLKTCRASIWDLKKKIKFKDF